jgi:T-complex protein 1 subunit zeta
MAPLLHIPLRTGVVFRALAGPSLTWWLPGCHPWTAAGPSFFWRVTPRPRCQAPRPPTALAGKPKRCSSWRLEGTLRKKVRDQTKAPVQPTSAISPSTPCPTCRLPSHCRHVRCTTPEPEGRVEGTPCPCSGSPDWGANCRGLQRRGEALRVNISAGEGLQDVLKSNLGPLGTIKMFVVSSLRLVVVLAD